MGKEKAPERFAYLEGLRGVASIVVVFYHALLIFYPVMMLGPHTPLAPQQNMRLEDNLYGTPFMAFLSGTFAVGLFFVLSGFVLSVGFFKTGREEIVKKLAAKRYIRLMLPALCIVMVGWLLMSLGVSHNAQAGQITHSGWISSQWNFTPDFFGALKQGLWGIFATGEHSYNEVLWTMQFEFIGSFMVFAVALLFGRQHRRGLIYAALVMGTFHTWYLGFVLGMVLADAYVHGSLRGITNRQGTVALLVGVFLGGYPAGPVVGTVYGPLQIHALNGGWNQPFYVAVGATLVILGILSVQRVAGWLAHPNISRLGSYTFSLYLVHKPILFTVATGSFVFLAPHMGHNRAALLTVMITAPFIVGATVLFERYVDRPSISLSNRFAAWYLNEHSASLRRLINEKRYALAEKLYSIEQQYKPVDRSLEQDVADELA